MMSLLPLQLVALGYCFGGVAAAAPTKAKPNFLILFADGAHELDPARIGPAAWRLLACYCCDLTPSWSSLTR